MIKLKKIFKILLIIFFVFYFIRIIKGVPNQEISNNSIVVQSRARNKHRKLNDRYLNTIKVEHIVLGGFTQDGNEGKIIYFSINIYVSNITISNDDIRNIELKFYLGLSQMQPNDNEIQGGFIYLDTQTVSIPFSENAINIANDNYINFNLISNEFYKANEVGSSGKNTNRIELQFSLDNSSLYGSRSYSFGLVFEGFEYELSSASGYSMYYQNYVPLIEKYNSSYDLRILSAIYAAANSSGYADGFDESASGTFSIEWLSAIFNPVSELFSIEIIPNFKLWYIIAVPLIISLIIAVLKILR